MSADVITLNRKPASSAPTNRRSAVSTVRLSGLELIPRRKHRGKLATGRQLAKLSFKPWPKSNPPDKPGPSGELMHSLGVSARIAAAITQQPKSQLIKFHETFDHNGFDEIMGDLIDTAERLKSMAYMIETAYLRILASAYAHEAAGGKFKHASA